jgi:endogenous inhibitor of DNA gyrase (YacG/DUF329 family)
MFQARCPICSKRFDVETIDDQPAFPFCSDRCKLIDLGRWLDGSYLVPGAVGPEVGGDEEPDPNDPDEDA